MVSFCNLHNVYSLKKRRSDPYVINRPLPRLQK